MFEVIDLIQSFRHAKQLLYASREEIKELQKEELIKTLKHAYTSSTFYRKLFEANNIQESDLDNPFDVLAQLPIVTKKDLMDKFEETLTESGIVKSDVEKFILSDSTGQQLYRDKYLALNTSGSSGTQGIFLFSPEFLENLSLAVLARISGPMLKNFTRKTRIAFIGEASGHHSGFSLIQNLPSTMFEAASIDVSASKEDFAKLLNDFKPHMLSGYPSGICVIADAAEEGLVNIKPERIVCSGEPLSEVRFNQIKNTFAVTPCNFYACTECLALGIDSNGAGALELFDQIVYVEVLDDNNKPVPVGTPGKVVITVLGNNIQPLIRYSLDDQLSLLNESPASPWTLAEAVSGRTLDKIHFKLKNKEVIIHPMDLVGLFIPGLKQYQIEQTGEASATFRLVAENQEQVQKYIDAALPEFLSEVGLAPGDVDLKIEFVKKIAPNPKTGKTPIVIALKTVV